MLLIKGGNHHNVRKACSRIAGFLSIIVSDDQNIDDVIIAFIVALRKLYLLKSIVLILIHGTEYDLSTCDPEACKYTDTQCQHKEDFGNNFSIFFLFCFLHFNKSFLNM